MTTLTGPVVDTSGAGITTTLWARPGRFRADGTILYAPEPVPYRIEDGHLSADLAPGPARLTIHRTQFHVTIPDEGTVTLASLIGDT